MGVRRYLSVPICRLCPSRLGLVEGVPWPRRTKTASQATFDIRSRVRDRNGKPEAQVLRASDLQWRARPAGHAQDFGEVVLLSVAPLKRRFFRACHIEADLVIHAEHALPLWRVLGLRTRNHELRTTNAISGPTDLLPNDAMPALPAKWSLTSGQNSHCKSSMSLRNMSEP